MVAGAVRWHSEGLGKPAAVESAVVEWQSDMDQFGRFIVECGIAGEFAQAKEQGHFTPTGRELRLDFSDLAVAALDSLHPLAPLQGDLIDQLCQHPKIEGLHEDPIFHGGKRAIFVVRNPDGSIKRDASGEPIGIPEAVREYSDTLLMPAFRDQPKVIGGVGMLRVRFQTPLKRRFLGPQRRLRKRYKRLTAIQIS